MTREKEAAACEHRGDLKGAHDLLDPLPESASAAHLASTVEQRLGNSKDALRLAEICIARAFSKTDAALVAKGQLRRGIALYSLGRFTDSAACFQWASKQLQDNAELQVWSRRLQLKMQSLSTAESSSLKEIPVGQEKLFSDSRNSAATNCTPNKDISKEILVQRGNSKDSINDCTSLPEKKESSANSGCLPRWDWYQTNTHITLDIFIKNVAPKDVSIKYDLKQVTMHISDQIVLDLDLYAPIKPTECKYDTTRKKVEIVLCKETQQNWLSAGDVIISQRDCSTTLDENSTGKERLSTVTNLASAACNATVDKMLELTGESTVDSPQKLNAPSSSFVGRRKKKNWDEIAKLADEDEPSNLSSEEQLNQLFQSIYSKADDDTRRAMMKSYIESNGTALSTNWSEVGHKKYMPEPPENQQLKQFK